MQSIDVKNILIGTTGATAAYVGDTLWWPLCQVEEIYGIRTTRTSGFANNDIVLNFNTSATLRVDVKFKLLAGVSGVAFGGRTNDLQNSYRLFYSGEYRWLVGPDRVTYNKARALETLEMGNLYLKDLTNGDIWASGTTQTAPSLPYLVNIGYMEFYWLKAYEGNTLIFDGVPAKKCGVYGIYDRLSNTFFEAQTPEEVTEIQPTSSYTVYTRNLSGYYGSEIAPYVDSEGQWLRTDNKIYLNFKTSENLRLHIHGLGIGYGDFFGGGDWNYNFSGGTKGTFTIGNSSIEGWENYGTAPYENHFGEIIYDFGMASEDGTRVISGATVQNVIGDRFWINVGLAQFTWKIEAWEGNIMIFDGEFGTTNLTDRIKVPLYANTVLRHGGIYDNLTGQFFRAEYNPEYLPCKIGFSPNYPPEEHIIYE